MSTVLEFLVIQVVASGAAFVVVYPTMLGFKYLRGLNR